MLPSSRGLGHPPFTQVTRVRISLGVPLINMNMYRSITTQLDITINQDWSKIISIYKDVVYLQENDKLPPSTYLEEIASYHHDLGDLGSLTILDEVTVEKKKASFLHGKIFENHLPWANKLREDFAELNLNAFCLFYSNQDILKHTDRSGIAESPTDICKINFFLQDSDSTVYVEKDGIIESIPAVANTGWLMNVVNSHWTTSNDDLFMLQICFYKPYDEVLKWFAAHPGLSYS